MKAAITAEELNQMSFEQRMLRYALCVDIDCMLDEGMGKQQIEDWFKSDEAKEVYSDKLYNHEDYLQVLENEILQRYQQYFNKEN